MGFEVRFTLSDALTDAGLDTFWDVFIRDAIEANDGPGASSSPVPVAARRVRRTANGS